MFGGLTLLEWFGFILNIFAVRNVSGRHCGVELAVAVLTLLEFYLLYVFRHYYSVCCIDQHLGASQTAAGCNYYLLVQRLRW